MPRVTKPARPKYPPKYTEESPVVVDARSSEQLPEWAKKNDRKAHTDLTRKEFSPLVIRKVTKFGFPIYVGIITDDNLDTLDSVIVRFIKANKALWDSKSIQDKRNLAGLLCERITEEYPATEGVGIVLYVDKCCISSLFGDFMNHTMCRQEFYSLLVMGTQV